MIVPRGQYVVISEASEYDLFGKKASFKSLASIQSIKNGKEFTNFVSF